MLYKKSFLPLFALVCASCGSQSETREELEAFQSAQAAQPTAAAAPDALDPRRSFAVTDKEILAPFTFKRVMDQLVNQSKVPGLTAGALFRQWWDTQNPKPGLVQGMHCDDQVSTNGTPLLNGFPYSCRPLEGAQANLSFDPFSNPDTNPDAYIPIGLFNRFDLAPKNGSFCGEYRVVFAKRSGVTDEFQRNLIIFEGALRNPNPQSKLAGCKKVAEFWAALSKEDKVDKRSKALEKFYFDGLTGTAAPAINVSAYGDNEKNFGQIRVNSFINPAGSTSAQVPWSLREFKLLRTGCDAAGNVCSAMKVVPVTVKSNPFGGLLNPAARDVTSPTYYLQAPLFQDRIDQIVPTLLATDLNEITMDVADAFNSAQSLASGSSENRYDLQLGTASSPLRTAIAAKLVELGSPLTVEQTLRRAMTVSCAGCHRFNNKEPNNDLGGGMVWPASLGFTHVSENAVEADVPTRFQISDALKTVFLPKRIQVMDNYLRTGKGNPNDNDTESDRPIKGGGRDE